MGYDLQDMEAKKPYHLKLGETFSYTGAFGRYTLLDNVHRDPRGLASFLLFVANEDGRIMPMSLPATTDCEVDPEQLPDLDKVESLRVKMESVREEHFKVLART